MHALVYLLQYMVLDHIPSTELMTPMHGFALVWLGLRTRSLGSGGSLGEDAALASVFGVFLPATILIEVPRV